MVGRLKLDERPLAERAGMQAGLEVERRRGVDRQLCRKPAEVGRLALPPRCLPEPGHSVVILLAKRDPDTPGKGLAGLEHRNLDEPVHEEPITLDHALVRRKAAVLVFSQVIGPVLGCGRPIRHGELVVPLTA